MQGLGGFVLFSLGLGFFMFVFVWFCFFVFNINLIQARAVSICKCSYFALRETLFLLSLLFWELFCFYLY